MMNYKSNIDNQLREIFKGVSTVEPSSGFTDSLMKRIQQEAVRAERRRRLFEVLQLLGGIIALLLTPYLIYLLLRTRFPELSLQKDFQSLFADLSFDISPFFVMICIAVLLLLIGDMLLRKRLFMKRYKEESQNTMA